MNYKLVNSFSFAIMIRGISSGLAVLTFLLLNGCNQSTSHSEEIIYSEAAELPTVYKKEEAIYSVPEWAEALLQNMSEEHKAISGVKMFKTLNDRISFCIAEILDGVCSRSVLCTFKDEKIYKTEIISEQCDHDGANPVYSWLEYTVTPDSTTFVVCEFTQSIPESYLDENGLIVNGKSFHDFDDNTLLTDSTYTRFTVSHEGSILRK